MKIEKQDSKKDTVLRILIKDSNLHFANMLRRAIISKVPVVAINTVTFYDNSSAVFDEYISHRLGLVPLETPAKAKPGDEFTFVLDVSGPKKVYSSDLQAANHKIKPAIDDIPILTLLEGQSLRLEAKAVVDYGSKHAKFQPGFASYAINDKNGEISFKVESFYQMSAKELVSRALKILGSDVEKIVKAVEKAK